MTSPSQRRCRLYLITPPEVADTDGFLRQLDEALAGGDVASLQIRLKSADGLSAPDSHILEFGRRVIPHAQARGIAVLLNDRPDLALALGADGVHLGQDDMSCAQARRQLGPDAVIGVTCHDSRHLAMEAGEAGADYVAFGAFYPTGTKQPRTAASPDILQWWQEIMELPCVAIGGITAENAAPLVEAGADFLAVSAGVWRAACGPREAVARFNALFEASAG